MNVFVLPSWYPSATQPAAGLFVREQVKALAACAADVNIAVGLWGHHDGALSLRSLRTSARALRWRLGARESWRECNAAGRRWHEGLVPRLSWTLSWAGGGARGLLQASRRNLERAQQQLGRVDLIHAHVGFPAGWMASVLGAEYGVPYVLTEHMAPFPTPQLMRAGRPTGKLAQAFRQARAVIAVSPALADDIRKQALPCSEVIPNVVDMDRFAAAASQAPSAPAFVLLSLGTLTQRKGMDVLLKAFARWNPPASAVQLHLGGDGPERQALESLARRLGLTDRVRFLGALAPEQVPEALARCHAFVLASHHETFGVVIAEALASGRPVLATRSGGPQFIVGPDDGVLVEPGDVDALAQGLQQIRVLARDARPLELRERAAARFGPEVVASRLLEVYRRVLQS